MCCACEATELYPDRTPEHRPLALDGSGLSRDELIAERNRLQAEVDRLRTAVAAAAARLTSLEMKSFADASELAVIRELLATAGWGGLIQIPDGHHDTEG